jgi:hypothetical protein
MEIKMKKIKCSRCIYKQPFNKCGNNESPYFNQKMEPDNICDLFEENPAQEHLTNGLILSTESKTEETIKEFEQALEFGFLPADDEVTCLICLGTEYLTLAVALGEYGSYKDAKKSEKIKKGISYIEKGLEMDSREKYNFFNNKIMRIAHFSLLDSAYAINSVCLKKEAGLDSAISYLQCKLRIFDYIPGTHLPMVHCSLGDSYLEKSKLDLAASSSLVSAAAAEYKKVINAEFPSSNNSRYLKIREDAKKKLYIIEQIYGR